MQINTHTNKLTRDVVLDVNEALLLIASLSEAVRLVSTGKTLGAFAGGMDCLVPVAGKEYLGTANFTVFKEHA